MKIKTSELTGAALDWATLYARCLEANGGKVIQARDLMDAAVRNGMASPSTDWSQGGPIIEREGINIFRYNKLDAAAPWVWCGHKVVPHPNMEGSTNMVAITVDGPTPLISAMRCYVASQLGKEIDTPKELFREITNGQGSQSGE